ncbi:site-specific integrase [Sphingobacterium paucimobilis]|nr:site-specific integrase [Sphingobacterium paucimobilis]
MKTRTNVKGICPIRCRITYNSYRKEFSTGLFINPKNWNNKKQVAIPNNQENSIINNQLSIIKNKINQGFIFLQLHRKDSIDVDMIYSQFKGENIKEDKFISEAFNLHNNKMKALVNIDVAITTLEKYQQTENHVLEYIKFQYSKKDIRLKELNLNFLYDFDLYLKTEKSFKTNTIQKTIQRLRKIIRLAVSMDFIEKDPFTLYRSKRHKKDIIYLNQFELRKLEEFNFNQEKLNYIRDLFVFCCYTGLAFNEMQNLSEEHIMQIQGNRIIKMIRQKTNKSIFVPLLPRAEEIIEKYKKSDSDICFPNISNQKFNVYIKEVAFIVGINKTLTHHVARKTFATTVLLYNDIPIEIVSKLLGHSRITMTQEYYAEIMDKKVVEAIEIVKNKI